MDTNLAHALANDSHRLAVVGVIPALYLIELIASLAACVGRESLEVLSAATHPNDPLHRSMLNIAYLCKIAHMRVQGRVMYVVQSAIPEIGQSDREPCITVAP